MNKLFLSILLVSLFSVKSIAQFSPPGMGDVNTASWLAFGVKQNLNSKKTTNSATFFGIGSSSGSEKYNPIHRKEIYVINQEITHRFKKNWEYSGAVSYRYQNKYSSEKPYHLDDPKFRQELRFYTKLSYLNTYNSVAYSFTFRPEMRFFYNPDFKTASKKMQFRTRFRTKIALDLNATQTKKIIATAEILLASTKKENWEDWNYTESRFCLYYSISNPQHKVTFNIGYMNDLAKLPVKNDAHYLALDISVNDLF